MSNTRRRGKKHTVHRRDEGLCHYCDEITPFETGSVDHVVAIVNGGCHANWNLVWSCKPCNEAKDDRWPTCPCSFCSIAVLIHARQEALDATTDVRQADPPSAGNPMSPAPLPGGPRGQS